MALHFITETPKKLLDNFKKAIDEKHVVTWLCDVDGDFTHTTDQWKNKAWLVPHVIDKTELVFTILPPKGGVISSEVYAIYHGRFLEAMLRHCDTLFEKGFATAMPEKEDKIRSTYA